MTQPMAGTRQVRDALLRLHDLPYLQAHSLGPANDSAAGQGPMGRGRALQQRILDAIEALRPTGAGGQERIIRRHQLLLLRYVEGLDVPAVCARLGISKTEYYREHQEGIDALVGLLVGPGNTDASESAVLAAGPAPSGRAFVGRGEQLQLLTKAFGRAAVGESGLALVAGEPGIGKTALCEELSRFVLRSGGVVLAGRCYEENSLSLPYLAFVEALQAYVESRPAEALIEELGVWAAELARIVPELQARVLVPAQPAGDPQADRYRLFQAVATVLRNTSQERPLLLVLEDLHDADKGTLDLLVYLAHNLSGARMLVLGTYRDVEVDRAHPLSGVLAELWRGPLLARLHLGGLAEAEVQELLVRLSGTEVPPTLSTAVHRKTEGNPLFVQEILRYLVQEGRVPAASTGEASVSLEALRVPEGVREVIGRRLSLLSDACYQVLQLAAVVGREVELPLLERIAGLDEEAFLSTIEEALEGKMVVESAGKRAPIYDFSHALVRQVLYEELSLPRKQRLHLRAAQAMEELYSGNLGPRVGALATHYKLAGAVGDPAKVFDYSLKAGEAAAAVFAWEEAAGHWTAALDVESQEVDPAARAALLEQLGDLLWVSGLNHEHGINCLEEAATLYDATGQGVRAAQMHARLGHYLCAVPARRDIPRAMPHFEAAERVLDRGPQDAALVDLYLGMGSGAFFGVRMKEAERSIRRALDLAERLGQPGKLLIANGLYGYYLVAQGQIGEGRRLLEGVWEEADESDQVYACYMAAIWLAYSSHLLRDPRTTQQWCRRELSRPRLAGAGDPRESLEGILAGASGLSGELGDAHWGPMSYRTSAVAMWPVELAVTQGHWEEAAALAAKEQQRFRATGDRWLETFITFEWARLERAQGNLEQAERLLRVDVATAVEGSCPILEMRFRPELALLLASTGRPEEAAPHIARCREMMASGEDWRGLAGRVALAEAVMTAACGRGAEASFQEALDVFAGLSLPWYEADAFFEWGRALSAAGDDAGGAEKLNAALATYHRIGAADVWLRRLRAAYSAPNNLPGLIADA